MSLPSSCLPWHFSLSAVFKAWGEKTLHLAQYRVRSWSWRRSLDSCSGCSFIDFGRICASTLFSCCLRGNVQGVFCLSLWGWGFSVHELPLKSEVLQRTKHLPSAPRPLPQLSHTNSICFPALGQHSQHCWWRAWKCPVSSGTIWLISLTSHVRQTTTA